MICGARGASSGGAGGGAAMRARRSSRRARWFSVTGSSAKPVSGGGRGATAPKGSRVYRRSRSPPGARARAASARAKLRGALGAAASSARREARGSTSSVVGSAAAAASSGDGAGVSGDGDGDVTDSSSISGTGGGDGWWRPRAPVGCRARGPSARGLVPTSRGVATPRGRRGRSAPRPPEPAPRPSGLALPVGSAGAASGAWSRRRRPPTDQLLDRALDAVVVASPPHRVDHNDAEGVAPTASGDVLHSLHASASSPKAVTLSS